MVLLRIFHWIFAVLLPTVEADSLIRNEFDNHSWKAMAYGVSATFTKNKVLNTVCELVQWNDLW